MDAERKRELGKQLITAASRGESLKAEFLILQGANVNHTDTNPDVSAFFLWCAYYQCIIMCYTFLLMWYRAASGRLCCVPAGTVMWQPLGVY
jgi:hypothetical protein